ncbi:hypothetical protein ASPFODRAFT_63724 [Aspergillus luchuensis CBS 106.47]|uniref:Uncharacterized protein n=1 Tax=Aspergillus luchuensis (strain CBS 106.47) TaxID=1137211 RepID=A0A1M3T704_ASPLC|nr:hypothetical protein ASPFODRAFT_63724 [Aspergillus luchuensis CBS 106.47]
MQLFRYTRPKDPIAVPTTSLKSIDAGYCGYSYSEPLHSSGKHIIAAVAEPSEFKRRAFSKRFIWRTGKPLEGQAFSSLEDFISHEVNQRELERLTGTVTDPGIDAVFVCLLDELHTIVVQAVAPLVMNYASRLYIMCEKLLAMQLNDLLCIYGIFLKSWEMLQAEAIFAVGLVLWYSHPQSCHDIDFLFWLLCLPASIFNPEPPHLTSKMISSGHLHFFRQANKSSGTGTATNYLSCPGETTSLRAGNRDRPIDTIGLSSAAKCLLEVLGEDYDNKTPVSQVSRRNWYRYCALSLSNALQKLPSFHMVVLTDAISRHHGHKSGSTRKIVYGAVTIHMSDFSSGFRVVYNMPCTKGGHDGDNNSLALSLVRAVAKVKRGDMSISEAQRTFLNCTVQEFLRKNYIKINKL